MLTIESIAAQAIDIFEEILTNREDLDFNDAEDCQTARARALTEISEGCRKLQAALDSLPKCPSCGDPIPVDQWADGKLTSEPVICADCRAAAEAVIADRATGDEIPF